MATLNDIWIDSHMIDEISDLAWLSKSLASGLLHGLHRSTRLSYGIEFSQYRPYVPGDDPRLIDLKMVAKTDRYYIKQSVVDTQHQIHFIIDDTKSMSYKENDLSKFHLAKLLVGTISYIATQQGDRYGWSTSEQMLEINTGMNHWKRCISQLSTLNINALSTGKITPPFNHGVIIWLTDLYDDLEQIRKNLNLLKAPKVEMILLHISGSKEENLEFNSNATFVDLETDEVIETHIPTIKKSYLKKYHDHLREVKKLTDERGIFLHKIKLGDHLPHSLKAFFDIYNSIDH